ncbi:hypothetical protein RJ639_027000 [Escallonia herrerae]|uniref:Uncharacterized protein n=1 Tax=Escallonia herrerae TaxID=1293975 RepID=A0AA89BDR5_9ASTE|nr:hypothetical protein RJ639_027000 [Escallonia herrerae]
MNLQMNKQRETCILGMMKVAMGLMGVCLAGYIVGPPLYWHLAEALPSVGRPSCPPCLCDCSSQSLLSIPEGIIFTYLFTRFNNSFTECMKHEPGMNEETEKNFTALLSEELKLREAEALESHQRADKALLEAKKMEADKCNMGMGTCEEAREKAEAALQAQREVTVMWELRARQKGWKEGIIK